jgi:glycosyltransferase involved in cell wall biosynthesis
MLRVCLESLLQIKICQRFEIIVVDNDYRGSGKNVVDNLINEFNIKNRSLIYSIEPEQGIPSARNHAVALAQGEYIAFIDDDEVADPLWLENLYKTILSWECDGVWGPVVPVFPKGFPGWQKTFFKRNRMMTGASMVGVSKGTGNVLLKRKCLKERPGPFDVSLNQVGGEDTDLFNWLTSRGKKFVWCDEAVVYETQPLARTKLCWHLIRSYRGGWGFAHQRSIYLGRKKAFLLILGWVLPATFKNFFLAIRYGDPRIIALAWLRILSTQAGKLGYFGGKKFEEYQSKL